MAARGTLHGLTLAFMVIDLAFVSIRLWVRLTMAKIGYDDYALFVALVGFILMCPFCLVSIAYDFGVTGPATIATMVGYNAMEGFKYFTISQIIVALVLHRIVSGIKHVQRMLVSSIIVVGLYSLACVLVGVTQCIPLQAVWGDGTGKCISTQSLACLVFAVSALDTASALLYAVLPFLLRGMQMSLRTKISIIFVLSLGAVTVVFSVVRLKSLIKIFQATSTADAVDLELEPFVYSVLEFGISIFTASLVGLWPLVRYLPFGGSGISTGDKRSNINELANSAANKTNTFELGYRKQNTTVAVRLDSQENAESQRGIVPGGHGGGVWKSTQYRVEYSPKDKTDGKGSGSDTNGDSD